MHSEGHKSLRKEDVMTIQETIKMQRRAEFKRLINAAHLSTKGLDRLEASYDALVISDYARFPMYRKDVQQVETLLKKLYGEGAEN